MDDDAQPADTNSDEQFTTDNNAQGPGTPPVFSEDTNAGGDEDGDDGALDESFPIADGEGETASPDGGGAADAGLPDTDEGDSPEQI